MRELRDDLTDWLVATTRPTTTHGPEQDETEQTIFRYQHSANADGKFSARAVRESTDPNYL